MVRHHHAAAGLIVALVLGACAGAPPAADPSAAPPGTAPSGTVEGDAVPPGPITGDYLCRRPEVNLAYPNSAEFSRRSKDENVTTSASCTVMFTSADDQQRIYDFFTTWLTDHGYHYVTGISTTTDASARSFQKADCRQGVTLAVKSPQGLRNHGASPPVQADTKTVFEVTTSIRRSVICYPEKPIPTPPPTPAPRLP